MNSLRWFVGNHFGSASVAMLDEKNFCALGSNQSGTICGTPVLNGWARAAEGGGEPLQSSNCKL